MFESPHKLQRLAAEKAKQYHHQADIARALAGARPRHGWRWHLGETLLTLATRLSPSHRTLLDQLQDCLHDAPLSDGNAAA